MNMNKLKVKRLNAFLFAIRKFMANSTPLNVLIELGFIEWLNYSAAFLGTLIRPNDELNKSKMFFIDCRAKLAWNATFDKYYQPYLDAVDVLLAQDTYCIDFQVSLRAVDRFLAENARWYAKTYGSEKTDCSEKTDVFLGNKSFDGAFREFEMFLLLHNHHYSQKTVLWLLDEGFELSNLYSKKVTKEN